MTSEEQTKPAKTEFVSWLVVGSAITQADYTSPTCVKNWLEANPRRAAHRSRRRRLRPMDSAIVAKPVGHSARGALQKKSKGAVYPARMLSSSPWFGRYIKRSKSQ
jgi:hypothetical protein